MAGAIPIIRQTFLQKARADLRACNTDEAKGFCLTAQNHTALVTLLREGIQAAAEKNYDDELLLTYQAIDRLIAGWWGGDPVRAIIRNTLEEVAGDSLERQDAQHRAVRDLAEARRTLAVEEKTNRDLRTALTNKDETLGALRDSLALNKQMLACVRGASSRLRRQTAELLADVEKRMPGEAKQMMSPSRYVLHTAPPQSVSPSKPPHSDTPVRAFA
jgi:hypothetical protein